MEQSINQIEVIKPNGAHYWHAINREIEVLTSVRCLISITLIRN